MNIEIESLRPLLALAIPIAGALLIFAAASRPNLRDLCSVAAALAQFLVVASMVPPVMSGGAFRWTLLSFLPQVSIGFRVDALGVFFAVIASFLWVLTAIYSIGYLRALDEHAQTRFHALFAISMAAAIGVAFAVNLVTLYLFYETLTLVTYPLVTHHQTGEAFAAGRRYLFYQLGSGIALLLPAIILTFGFAGTFDFRPGGVFPAAANHAGLVATYLLFLAGIAKAAIMPFHLWLPAAMVAPTPVSALLHAVAVVNTGVFSVLRVILHIFGEGLMRELDLGVITLIATSITILLASIFALKLDNLKALLAYSTIGQLSYMVLGAAMLTPSGMAGGVIHLANHSVSKITLFFCAGAIYVALRQTSVSEMRGIGRQLPWTLAAFAVAAVSIVGLPPTAGFITKWHLMIGALEARQVAVLIVLLVGTLLSAAYYFPIIGSAFFGTPADARSVAGAGHPGPARLPRELSPLIVAPLVLTALICLAIGIYPDPLLAIVQLALQQ